MNAVEDKQREMVGVLRAMGKGWHSRAALAAQMGKNRLNPGDIMILEILASNGVVEKSTAPTELPHITQSVYRVKEGN